MFEVKKEKKTLKIMICYWRLATIFSAPAATWSKGMAIAK
jgi:hypothetical protein